MVGLSCILLGVFPAMDSPWPLPTEPKPFFVNNIQRYLCVVNECFPLYQSFFFFFQEFGECCEVFQLQTIYAAGLFMEFNI